ncbi:MAG: AAA family ATPase [Candidatus Cryptobacteroides sp.]|nr:AAA family ATPase [Bacteroidales bacterium]MDY2774839.1 AAA family ATPase [Candidatus Cryptobacteroides sp.]
MLYRKIEKDIEGYLRAEDDRIMILEGARQIGKSFIIREVGKKLYDNFIEINFAEDDEGPKIFKGIGTTEEFYFTLSSVYGEKLDRYENTLIFLDEIQHYPQYLTLLKFFREDRRFRFIASGSLLGITLRETTSIPVGSIIRKNMYQLDFEEFLIANGFGQEALNTLRTKLMNRESLDESLHDYIMNLFRRYLLVGGLPAAVNEYLDSHNIVKVRNVQENIRSLYEVDATKYEKDSNKTLLIRRIYNMIPSQLENKKKRIIIKDIQNKIGDRFDNYLEEFEYLISSGTALKVSAISNPKYPLAESAHKNLMKLYLNDVGLLTMLLYKNSIRPVISDEDSVNLGSVYESVVAQELKAHGHKLFYYDNKQRGEVDFLIDDYSSTTILPIEVKSGKDYTRHSALNNLLKVRDYDIASGLVLSNSREIKTVGNVSYMPVYYVMFIDANAVEELYF